jgi:hypothetical protein
MKVSTAHHRVESRVVGQSGLEAHYRTLQLSPSADLELVERTYWLLAFRYHHQGQREALRRLNEAMSAVVSALADEGAVGGRTAAATEPRPGALTTLAWEAGWLIVTASAVSLALGLAAGAMELKGGLQVLEEWHGVMVGGGAFGLGAVATIAALASFVPALGRFLRSRVPQTAALPDHYEALHLDPLASPEVVELAYQHLSTKYRLAGAEERLLSIEEAYRVLRDPHLRASYDAQLAMARATPTQQAPRPFPAHEPTPSPSSAPPMPDTATVSPRAERLRTTLDLLPLMAKAAATEARRAAWAMAITVRWLWRVWRLAWPRIVQAAALGARTMASAFRGIATAALQRVQAGRAQPQPMPSPHYTRLLQTGTASARASPRWASRGVTVGAQVASQPSAPPTARLVVEEGPMAGRSFDLRPDAAVTLGTDPRCDIVLEAPPGTLPLQLARIWPREDRFMLHLLAPEVPAFIQGRPLVWVVLEDGDLLELGPYRLRFEVVRQGDG